MSRLELDNVIWESEILFDLHESMASDEFPYNVHIRREFLQASIGTVFASLFSSSKLDTMLLMVRLEQYIVLSGSIVSFYQHHQTLAYLYSVRIRNNRLDSRVHIVYN